MLGNLQMVYQFLFDVYLFDTNFNELQYWGIGIIVLTFAIDVYLTVKRPAVATEPAPATTEVQ